MAANLLCRSCQSTVTTITWSGSITMAKTLSSLVRALSEPEKGIWELSPARWEHEVSLFGVRVTPNRSIPAHMALVEGCRGQKHVINLQSMTCGSKLMGLNVERMQLSSTRFQQLIRTLARLWKIKVTSLK